MIYRFFIRRDDGTQKEFLLTADSESACIKRAMNTYAVPADRINLVEYYKEVGTIEVDPTPISIGKKVSVKEQKKNNEVSEMFYSAPKKRGEKKKAYIKKYGFKEKQISSPEDLSKLLKKYKKVKCYWEPSDKRGVHQYYALYK